MKTRERRLANKIATHWFVELRDKHSPLIEKRELANYVEDQLKRFTKNKPVVVKRNLTKNQVDFIINNFFTVRISNNAYWKRIAEKLILEGKCTASGDIPIWLSTPISNFIRFKTSEIGVGCLDYYFNFDEFIKSQCLKEKIEESREEIINEIHKKKKNDKSLDNKINDIIKILES